VNRLSREQSPYLRQHRKNPVDWYPWGEEALQKARDMDRPIFLSIGYAACHWCHVMERESFENQTIAGVLNEHFVPVKVDREERPDIDHLYMTAVQMMTGAGGWPLTVFLTPEGKPFFGGTYFPPEDRWGRPGLLSVLREVMRVYRDSPEDLERTARTILAHLEVSMGMKAGTPDAKSWMETYRKHRGQLEDVEYGGYGQAPKFPSVPDLEAAIVLDPGSHGHILLTLERMALGGIHDHVGGGFHRYSTTVDWRVPHYEKMLYDQALLIPLYMWAFQRTGSALFERTLRGTIDFMNGELFKKDLGYITSLDADSDGEEGTYYLWRRNEVLEVSGKDEGTWFADLAHLEENPSPIHLQESTSDPERFTGLLGRLRKRRHRRVRPAEDTKVLTSLNGLALRALALAGAGLSDERIRNQAVHLAHTLSAWNRRDGTLLHAAPGTGAEVMGMMEDYAYLAWGFLTLFETTGEPDFLGNARQLIEEAKIQIPGFSLSASEDLPLAPRNLSDGALPSPLAVFLLVSLKIQRIEGKTEYPDIQRRIEEMAGTIGRAPASYPTMVRIGEWIEGSKSLLVVACRDRKTLLKALQPVRFAEAEPHAVLPVFEGGVRGLSSLEGRNFSSPRPLYFLCRDRTCLPETTRYEDLPLSCGPDLRGKVRK